ncbi:MAG TPA: hypothetical protein VKG84_03485 [Candidatus Acidoferrales bacterium]|nr:hypothetical protein [Candidatus Acidoferrales bacterium]
MKTAFFSLVVATAILPSLARAQTADEIIAKNLAARGGIEKMRAIRTIAITGKLTAPDGGGGPLLVRLMRPDRIREEVTFGPAKSVRSFDGESAWVLDEDKTGAEARPLTGADLANLRDEGANGIDGALADYATKGNAVTFAGAAVIDGKTCYKLKVELRSGHILTQYIDSQTFLEIYEELVRNDGDNETVIDETVGDYRSEGGILFAHTFVSGVQGHPERFTLTIEKIELNPAFDASLFRMPKGKVSNNAIPQSVPAPDALPGKKLRAASNA